MRTFTYNSICYFTYSYWKIVGIIDSDGSYGFRLTKRKGGFIGFSFTTSIAQTVRNSEFLEHLHRQLGVSANLRTRVTGTFKNGQPKMSRVFDIAWTTSGGQALLKILDKCPPRVPAKLHDYLIGLVFLEAYENKYVFLHLEDEPWTHEEKRKVTAVACIFLYYNTSNEINPFSKTQKKKGTPREWVNYLNPTDFEYHQGYDLFLRLFHRITHMVQAQKDYFTSGKAKLPLDYIRGFYIGDGCITISFHAKTIKMPGRVGKKTKVSLKAVKNSFCPYKKFWFLQRVGNIRRKRIFRFDNNERKLQYYTSFSFTGDYDTQSLFSAVQSTFGTGFIWSDKDDNKSVYKIGGWKRAKTVVLPLLENQDLPTFRCLQFQTFKKAIRFYESGMFCDPKYVKKLVTLIHDMNRGGQLRRKTKESKLRNFRILFKTRKVYN